MSNIPVWVYILFVALVYLGIKRCYTRVFHIKRLLIVPIVFLFISFRGTLSLFTFNEMTVLYLLLGWLIGLLIGHMQVRNSVIKADKQQRLIQTPGDVSMLIMILVIFSIEFTIHYAIDAHWQIALSSGFKFFAIVASGIVVGISIGRNASYYYKYLHARSEILTPTK